MTSWSWQVPESSAHMNPNPSEFALHYQNALRTHLDSGPRASLLGARGLGAMAVRSGIQTLELAKLHEQILLENILLMVPDRRKPAMVRRAGKFFAAALVPVEVKGRAGRETLRQVKIIEALSQRTVELATANLKLNLEIRGRIVAEDSLKVSERRSAESLEQAMLLKEQLRELSRQLLIAQEEERKKISRELHDVIAQTLMGINIRLATLKKEASYNTKGLDRNITETQKLVARSADIVHKFARELRPAMLDDLGLLPALQAYLKIFTDSTRVLVDFTSIPVDSLDVASRTVLFRVAQEALTNVARHARATNVRISIAKAPGGMRLKIVDDGKGFQLQNLLLAGSNKRLGLLGMRERVEMVGGSFEIVSAVGKGTRVTAIIPTSKAAKTTRKIPRKSIPPAYENDIRPAD